MTPLQSEGLIQCAIDGHTIDPWIARTAYTQFVRVTDPVFYTPFSVLCASI